MKIDFSIDQKNYVEYCAKCHSANTLTRTKIDGDAFYSCTNCKAVEPRAIIIDPKISSWIDEDNEYCHKSVGVFIFNRNSEFLMFKLNKFPFGWTIPAGHVDDREVTKDAAQREAKEETGLEVTNLKHISTLRIDRDGCRRGSDRHYWDVYCVRTDDSEVTIDSNEGSEFAWLTLDQAVSQNNTFAVDFILKNLGSKLQGFVKSL